MRRERAARAFLLETLTDDLMIGAGQKQFAFEVFRYLEEIYEAKNWGNLVSLREQFSSVKYEDGEDMTVHLNKLKTIADKLGRQDKVVDDKERVCQLLTSLPASWEQFKSVYFTRDRPLPWSVMESSVMAEYTRRCCIHPRCRGRIYARGSTGGVSERTTDNPSDSRKPSVSCGTTTTPNQVLLLW